MPVRIFKRRYSSSRSPYARRWITRILWFNPLAKAERDLVLGFTVSRDPIPMPVDHRRELLIGFERLPLLAQRSPGAGGPGLMHKSSFFNKCFILTYRKHTSICRTTR